MSELLIIAENNEADDDHEIEEDVEPSIPLDIRISYADAHLIDDVNRNLGRIVDELGADYQWVCRYIRDLKIKPIGEEVVNNKTLPVYPGYTLAVLEDELAWRRLINVLPQRLTPQKMAESIGMPLSWVKETIAERNIKQAGRKKDQNKTPLYLKKHLAQLREVRMEVLSGSDWSTLQDLKELTGMDKRWIEECLASHGVYAEARRSVMTGKVCDHYPPESKSILQSIVPECFQPAGDWLTPTLIADYLDRSLAWVKTRLIEYETQSEIRLDDNERPRVHYSPAVYQKLKHALEIPVIGDDDIEVSRFAEWYGCDEDFLKERLNMLGSESHTKRTQRGKIQEVFTVNDIYLVKEHERKVNTLTFDLQSMVGSLKSQLRLRRTLLDALSEYDAQAVRKQRRSIKNEITRIEQKLNDALDRLYETEDEFDSSSAAV